MNKHTGSSFNSFLEEQGILHDCKKNGLATTVKLADLSFAAGKAGLTPRETEVIQRRKIFEHTLQSIGDDYNVTRERIRAIEQKALSKLKHAGFEYVTTVSLKIIDKVI